MAKRSEKNGNESQRQRKRQPATEYYKLHTKAVEDLASADAANSPKVPKAELERYGARKKSGMPDWIKATLIKFWFAGAIFFFIGMGMTVGDDQAHQINPENLILIIGIVLGMVTDILTNNALRFMAPTDGAYDGYMMFAKKRYITFPLNILYALVICLIVFLGLYPLAGLFVDLKAPLDSRSFLADLIEGPVGFGVFYLICDYAFIGLKHLVLRLVRGSNNKNV